MISAKFNIGKDIDKLWSIIIYHSGSYGLAFIENQKWKNKVYKLGKVDDRIQILQPARSRNKRPKETEMLIKKDGFKPSTKDLTKKW